MSSNGSHRRMGPCTAAAAAGLVATHMLMGTASAFSTTAPSLFGLARVTAVSSSQCNPHINKFHYASISRPSSNSLAPLFMSDEPKFEKMNEDDDQVIAFMDPSGTAGIDCYVDSYATVDGVEYTIGSPCDYAVALCYFDGEDDDEQLVPIELDDPLMDDVFPIAEGIIEDEFGEELVLLRTPQTLTLVGELEESELDEDDEDYDDDVGDDMADSEEEVEILVSFEEDGQEYHLVRLLDPVLLVGKIGNENTRILLTPEESDVIMPQLEGMFMNYQEEQD